MRLVLLPGLNGSALFAPLLAELRDIDCQVLELPEHGPQDYPSLADALMEQLGTTPFVLLGESYSGPLAYQLALRQPTGLRGVIFAASFLSRPNPALALLAHLPIPNALATQPWLLRTLCLGKTAGPLGLSVGLVVRSGNRQSDKPTDAYWRVACLYQPSVSLRKGMVSLRWACSEA